MNKKFELVMDQKIEVFGRTLFRIKALIAFSSVEEGELGGYVEKEDNLSDSGDAWVSGDARVYGNAEISGNAEIYGNARVSGDARVCGNARVYGNAAISGNAWVSGDARVSGDAWVSGDAEISGRNHYLTVGPIGSRDDTITFFRTKALTIAVKIGCFTGTIDEFVLKVKETHAENVHAKAYILAAEIAKMRIDLAPGEATNPSHDPE